MNFSNKFKVWWWIVLLSGLTIFAGFRVYAGEFKNFDIFLFIFWFILVLFPIISEISIFGVSVKKDIENATKELRSSIAEIKNHINFQPTINVNPPTPATPQEYQKKVEEEVKLEEKKEIEKSPEHKKDQKTISLKQAVPEKRTSRDQKTQEKLDKLFNIEKLISQRLTSYYGSDFRPQMKLSDESTGDHIIVDGLIFKGTRIIEIIEIKFFRSNNLEAFFFIAARYRNRLFRLFGLRIPIRFIIISETLDQTRAVLVKNQVNKLNFERSLTPSLPVIKADFFKYDNNKLIEVIPDHQSLG